MFGVEIIRVVMIVMRQVFVMVMIVDVYVDVVSVPVD